MVRNSRKPIFNDSGIDWPGNRWVIILLFVVAFWEFVLMVVFQHVKLDSLWIESSLDAIFVALLTFATIWILKTWPHLPALKGQNASAFHFISQQIEALDRVAIISVTSVTGIITYVNDNFCKISGYSKQELLGRDHRIINSGFHSTDFFRHMWSTIQSGQIWNQKIKNRKKDGSYYWVSTSIVPIFDLENRVIEYVSIRYDITNEKNFEEFVEREKIRTIHVNRLSTIGEMTTSIAHEINNPLSIISGHLYLNQIRLEKIDEEDNLQKIKQGTEKAVLQVERIGKIIRGLRSYAGSGESDLFKVLSLQEIIDSAKEFCEEKLVRLEVNFRGELVDDFSFLGRSIQLEQVFVNLISNSIDAISQLPEKWIQITAQQKGDFLKISVIDSGAGIKSEVIEKLMVPFFTTKPIGIGTGLGLSISREIIESHGGSITFETQASNTTFIIDLPMNNAALFRRIDLNHVEAMHLEFRELIRKSLLQENFVEMMDFHVSESDVHFSTWLVQIEPRFKLNPHFINLKALHTKFNEISSVLVAKLSSNLKIDDVERDQSIGSLMATSDQFLNELHELVKIAVPS